MINVLCTYGIRYFFANMKVKIFFYSIKGRKSFDTSMITSSCLRTRIRVIHIFYASCLTLFIANKSGKIQILNYVLTMPYKFDEIYIFANYITKNFEEY